MTATGGSSSSLIAVNQLADGHDLGWLPHELGSNVRAVVSCAEDDAAPPDSAERHCWRRWRRAAAAAPGCA